MKLFRLWNCFVALNNSGELINWNKTKIIGYFLCPKISYRPDVSIKADPFVCIYKDILYLFYEEKLKMGKGYIVCTWTSDLENWSSPITVLQEPFHLSFPFVFMSKEKVYMLPESNEANELRLYECVEFPNKWKLNKVIIDVGKYVDSSIICHDEVFYLFTTRKNGNEFYQELYYSFDLLNGDWIRHPKSPISKNSKYARNGGAIFLYNDTLYRPTQDCETDYGKNVSIFEIKNLSVEQYEEHLVIPEIFPISHFPLGGHHISFADYHGQRIMAYDQKTKEIWLSPLLNSFVKLFSKVHFTI